MDDAKEKAEELFSKFKVILILEDVDLGEEILCSLIAKKCALESVNEIIKQCEWYERRYQSNVLEYWRKVRNEIQKL